MQRLTVVWVFLFSARVSHDDFTVALRFGTSRGGLELRLCKKRVVDSSILLSSAAVPGTCRNRMKTRRHRVYIS